MEKKFWFVYIIENEKGHFYTGMTTDLVRRFKEHSDSKKGAKFFHTSSPKSIVFKKEFPNRSEAQKFEHHIKSLSRIKKIELINTSKIS
jgi:putative endonuclease